MRKQSPVQPGKGQRGLEQTALLQDVLPGRKELALRARYFRVAGQLVGQPADGQARLVEGQPGQVQRLGGTDVLDQGADADPAGQGRGRLGTERGGQPVAQRQDEAQAVLGLVHRGPPGQGIILVGLLVLVRRSEIAVQCARKPPRAEGAGADNHLAALGQPLPALLEQEVEFRVPDKRQLGSLALVHGLYSIRWMILATSAARDAPELPTDAINDASVWACAICT